MRKDLEYPLELRFRVYTRDMGHTGHMTIWAKNISIYTTAYIYT